MKVVVDTQSGSSFFIDVEFWDTALEIKQKIEKSQGIPLFKQTLFFQGKVLQDHLLYFEFQDSRLHLSISPDDNPNQKNNDHMPQTEQSPSAPSNPSHEFVNIQDWPVMSYNDQVPQTEESPSTPSNPIHEFVNNQDLPVMSNNDQVPETEESPMTLESKKEFFGIQDSPEGRNNQVLHQTEQSPLPSNSFGETVTIHKITHGQDSYVELALKNSQRNEKTLTGGAQNGDDFSVDDLLDFYDDVFVEDETELKVERKRGVSDENTLHWSNDFSTGDFPTSELSVPMDDLAELEWLSNFVEDSFTPYSAAPTKKPVWLTGNRRHPAPPVNEDPCFKAPPPSSSSGSSSPLWLADSEFLDEPMAKRQKQEKVSRNAGQTQTQTQTQTRRCSHCGVQKTPQWREVPAGAKTLCNACGLRYKSGRLLPEYRPTYSPTFSSELHSNRHRKVIEMRRNKGDLRRR